MMDNQEYKEKVNWYSKIVYEISGSAGNKWCSLKS